MLSAREERADEEPAEEVDEAPQDVPLPERPPISPEVAAAIGAALALAEAESTAARAMPGQRQQSLAGAWLQSGRARQMAERAVPRRPRQ